MSDHLYLHIPFCLKKCGYCDFYSLEGRGHLPLFLAALKREIRLRSASWVSPHPVKTLYFGGGTPSLVPVREVASLLDLIHGQFSVARDAEITLEANPGTVDLGYLRELRSLGVNRLSLGIQSFDNDNLRTLGRVHDSASGRAALDRARRAGFDNIGLDLIYGLPGQTRREWQKDLDDALRFGPNHLSCYMLTLEPGTPLHSRCETGDFLPMAPSGQIDLFVFVSEYLEDKGYDHYEISNFARGKKWRSRHNTAYWRMKPYAGFGPSAHSLGFDRGGSPVRSWNLSGLDPYLRRLDQGRLPVAETEVLTQAQQMAELVMVGLRTREGIDIRRFDVLSERPFFRRFSGLVETLEADGMAASGQAEKTFCLTREGWTRLDSIVAAFAAAIL